jgi:hypothetical protein
MTEGGQISINFEGKRADTVFFDPLFLGLEAQGMFRVMTNVVHKKDMGFIGHLNKILQKDVGCGFTPKGDLSIYDRTIETDKVKVDMSQCADELNNTIWEESKRKGVDANDLRGTVLSQVALVRIQQGISLDVQRLFWFGNKASTDANYNLLDGMWSVHIPELTTGANPVTPYVNSNSGSALNPGDALDILKEMYKEQSLALRGMPKAAKRFMVSRSIYENYEDSLETLGGGDAGRTALINGQEMLAYRGIPLIEMPYWDEYSETDLDQPEKHLALLTIPSNLVVATDLMSSMNNVKVRFEEFSETTDYKVKFKLGSNYVHPSLMVAAY